MELEAGAPERVETPEALSEFLSIDAAGLKPVADVYPMGSTRIS